MKTQSKPVKSIKPTPKSYAGTLFTPSNLLKGQEELTQILESQDDIEKKIAKLRALLDKPVAEKIQNSILTSIANFYAELSNWFTCKYNIRMEPPSDFIDVSDLYLERTNNPEELQYSLKNIYNTFLTGLVTKTQLDLQPDEELPEYLTEQQYSMLIEITSNAGHTLSEKDACNIAITHLTSAITALQQAITRSPTTKTANKKLTNQLASYQEHKQNLYQKLYSLQQNEDKNRHSFQQNDNEQPQSVCQDADEVASHMEMAIVINTLNSIQNSPRTLEELNKNDKAAVVKIVANALNNVQKSPRTLEKSDKNAETFEITLPTQRI